MTGRIFIILLNSATGVVTARALHPTGRGEQAAILLWPILLSNAATLGLPSSLTYHIRKYRERTPELVGISLAIALIASILCTALAVWLMPLLLANYSPEIVFYSRCLLCNIPVGLFMLVARAALEGKENFGPSILAQLLLPAFTLGPLLYLWFFHSMTPFSAGLAYSLNGFPVAAWLLLKLRQTTLIRFSEPIRTAKVLLSYGLRSYGVDLCGTLASYVDQALVVSILVPSQMGYYVVALSVSRMLNFCQASVVMVLLPKAAGLAVRDVASIVVRAARFSLLATMVCAVGSFVLAPLIIPLLYGSGFEGTILVLRVLLLEVTIGGTVTVLAQAPMALGRPGLTTTLQIVGLGLTIPLMLFLVPRYGILGAAVALLTTSAMRMILILAAFPLLLKLPTPRLWLNARDFLDLRCMWDSLFSRLYLSRTAQEMQ